MTRIALDIPAASQRLALRRWLEARGHEICAPDEPGAELRIGIEPAGDDPRALCLPLVQDRPDFDALERMLRRRPDPGHGALDVHPSPEGLIARSPGMRDLVERIDRFAATDLPVLITGESGTGKEVVARALHDRGPRAEEPFVAVNCAAIPEGLFESELFGHERGSFTDASRRRHGHFERAGAGTLFLDEIAEIPPAIQPKPLRALQDRVFHRVGGEREVEFRCRVISASAFDLESSPRFRTDLFHRIAGGRLHVPPLRERREDIPDLCRVVLARTPGHAVVSIDAAALDRLARFDWPGNVRQLENVLRQAAILSGAETLDMATIEGQLGEAGVAESRALDRALRAWASRRRAAGDSSAELREELLSRLREAEEEAGPDAGSTGSGE
jgi:DNA-binding NtrC family response regulator